MFFLFCGYLMGQGAAVGKTAATFAYHPEDPVGWLHVTDPSTWKVVPTSAFVLADTGVVMRQIAEPVFLMRHALTTYANELNFQDLLQCARFDNDVDVPEGAASPKDASTLPLLRPKQTFPQRLMTRWSRQCSRTSTLKIRTDFQRLGRPSRIEKYDSDAPSTS